MTLTFKLDLDSVKFNQHTKYLDKKVISFKRCCPDTHTHTRSTALPEPLKW